MSEKEGKKMLKNLLNKLRWEETMAVAAFAEAGDFGLIEKAVKREKKGRSRTARPKRKASSGILAHES